MNSTIKSFAVVRGTFATLLLLCAASLATAAPATAAPATAAPAAAGPIAAASNASPPAGAPAATRVLRNLAYGSDPKQRIDVYLPATARNAPVLFMVHGGAWAIGDKTNPDVVKNKAAYWLPLGFVVVSVNYRLVPQAGPLEQAADVARALAFAQAQAPSWGADPKRFVLMGHSSGGHLVTLLNAAPDLALKQGAQPWRAVVNLDSAAMDVPAIMQQPHARLYDRAFGADPAYWQSVSPWHVLTAQSKPILSLCSRKGDSCPQSIAYERKASLLHLRVTIWELEMSHMDINRTLGEKGPYTESVAVWINSIL